MTDAAAKQSAPNTVGWQQLAGPTLSSEELANAQWDLLVIGGGITGAGVLREAARRGLKTLLVEQQDFAWGTSSRSSKMVHGGLRYLGQGDYALTRHSLQERERLLKEAPGLVERLGYFFTMRQKKSPPGWAVKILLWLYDRMAGIRDHARVSLPELQDKFPGIATDSLKDCFYYTDAVTDDARLVMRVLQEARDDGATALNYVKAETLQTNDGGNVKANDNVRPYDNTITTVTLRNTHTEECLDVCAKAVVNATGAWADNLRHQLNPETRVRPLRGSHIVIAQERLPVDDAITLLHPQDQRAMFVFPWAQRTVIGTTDLDHQQPLDQEATITQAEVDYLLAAMNDLFPQVALREADIISTWSGVRPVIGSDSGKDPSKERRDHAVWRDANMVTVSGGKLTTFRLIALDVLNALQAFMDIPAANTEARVFKPSLLKSTDFPQCPAPVFAHLHNRFGNRAASILDDDVDLNTELKADLKTDTSTEAEHAFERFGDTCYSVTECRWILSSEAVRHLDDLMLRRTHLGLLFEQGGTAFLPRLKQPCMDILGWSEQRWHDEVQRYQRIWQQHYFLPQGADTSA